MSDVSINNCCWNIEFTGHWRPHYLKAVAHNLQCHRSRNPLYQPLQAYLPDCMTSSTHSGCLDQWKGPCRWWEEWCSQTACCRRRQYHSDGQQCYHAHPLPVLHPRYPPSDSAVTCTVQKSLSQTCCVRFKMIHPNKS